MDIQKAYDLWASQYDTNENKTRDLEGHALRQVLGSYSFQNVLEIGCGTGKNTKWLREKAEAITGIDLSEKMLTKARAKISTPKVRFIRADINNAWSFGSTLYNLITFSLVLEHIEDLDAVFRKIDESLAPGGLVYIGELHPFKQYAGSKARFTDEDQLYVVPCYTHHLSDFLRPAKQNGFEIVDISEYFDGEDKSTLPRILTVLLKKPE